MWDVRRSWGSNVTKKLLLNDKSYLMIFLLLLFWGIFKERRRGTSGALLCNKRCNTPDLFQPKHLGCSVMVTRSLNNFRCVSAIPELEQRGQQTAADIERIAPPARNPHQKGARNKAEEGENSKAIC